MDDFVPESAIDYDAIISRGGENLDDEDFAFFKCPTCGWVFLIDDEVSTVYLDSTDLTRREHVLHDGYFGCVECGQPVPNDEPWIGPRAGERFRVSWSELDASGWAWAARRE